MKPVYQVPGDNQCLRACVASIFDLLIDQVPFFGGHYAAQPESPESASLQDKEFDAWLRTRGLAVNGITVNPETGQCVPTLPWGVCEAYGPTVRGTYHSVVWDAGHWDDREYRLDEQGLPGRLVHDPHPSGAGLVRVEGFRCFVLRNPALLAPRVQVVA